MHLASTSKLITAMALTRLLDSKGIDYDSPVNPWLPTYWPRGNNIDKLTFSHLLTHKSGLLSRDFTGLPGPCDYPDMKAAIADGTNELRHHRLQEHQLFAVPRAAGDGERRCSAGIACWCRAAGLRTAVRRCEIRSGTC